MPAPSVTYSFVNGQTSDGPQVSQNFTDIINALSDGTKDLSISALTVAGVLTANGNVALGDATSDTITVTSRFVSDLIPSTSNARDLGTTSLRWKDLYLAGTATVTGAVSMAGLTCTTITASGAVSLNGAVTLGDASGDAITITGTPTIAAATTINNTLTVAGNGSDTGLSVSSSNVIAIGVSGGTSTHTVNGALAVIRAVSFGGSGTTSNTIVRSGNSNPLTSTSQLAFSTAMAVTSNANDTGSSFYGASTTAAASFTLPLLAQFYAQNVTKGASSTITRHVHYYAETPNQGTNNAAFADNISFTGNWFINSTNTNDSLLSGDLFLPNHDTTASAANCFIDSSTGEIQRSTSSARYKEEIRDLEIDSSKVLLLLPRSYKEKKSGKECFGLIAEEVNEVLPSLVDFIPAKKVIEGSESEDLIPDAVHYPLISVLLLAELKKLKLEVAALKGQA